MRYDRAAAVAYAHKWAYRRNPLYYDFSDLGGNCTNFASQCLYAGSRVMNFTPTFGWYYISLNSRAPAWTGVNELYRFLVNNTGAGPQAVETGLDEVDIGDIIQLRLRRGDGAFDHSPVVVDRGQNTPDTILVAANSNDADYRPLSTYNYYGLRVLHIVNVGDNSLFLYDLA